MPKKEIADEILKAQLELLKEAGKKIKVTEVYQELRLRRRLRRVEIQSFNSQPNE